MLKDINFDFFRRIPPLSKTVCLEVEYMLEEWPAWDWKKVQHVVKHFTEGYSILLIILLILYSTLSPFFKQLLILCSLKTSNIRNVFLPKSKIRNHTTLTSKLVLKFGSNVKFLNVVFSAQNGLPEFCVL